jgi:hypothetical protein
MRGRIGVKQGQNSARKVLDPEVPWLTQGHSVVGCGFLRTLCQGPSLSFLGCSPDRYSLGRVLNDTCSSHVPQVLHVAGFSIADLASFQ